MIKKIDTHLITRLYRNDEMLNLSDNPTGVPFEIVTKWLEKEIGYNPVLSARKDSKNKITLTLWVSEDSDYPKMETKHTDAIFNTSTIED